MREDISLTVIQSRDHILNTFDSEISDYAENRFKRKNINVVTNARVIRIEKDKVIYQPKTYGGEETNEPPLKEMDAGICLWSTGIGKGWNKAYQRTSPRLITISIVHSAMTRFAQRLADQINAQQHQRVLLTDEYLCVKGVPDHSIYALGDCASIQSPKLVNGIKEIFAKADK